MYAPRRSAASRQLPNPLAEQGRSFLGVIRYASGLLKQLPLQPVLAAFVAAFVLGAVPLMLTALYSVVRAVLDGYWRAVGLHRAETEITPTPEAIINHLELL
jgi:hypothetical protein